MKSRCTGPWCSSWQVRLQAASRRPPAFPSPPTTGLLLAAMPRLPPRPMAVDVALSAAVLLSARAQRFVAAMAVAAAEDASAAVEQPAAKVAVFAARCPLGAHCKTGGNIMAKMLKIL